jgi:hypothetical protein
MSRQDSGSLDGMSADPAAAASQPQPSSAQRPAPLTREPNPRATPRDSWQSNLTPAGRRTGAEETARTADPAAGTQGGRRRVEISNW